MARYNHDTATLLVILTQLLVFGLVRSKDATFICTIKSSENDEPLASIHTFQLSIEHHLDVFFSGDKDDETFEHFLKSFILDNSSKDEKKQHIVHEHIDAYLSSLHQCIERKSETKITFEFIQSTKTLQCDALNQKIDDFSHRMKIGEISSECSADHNFDKNKDDCQACVAFYAVKDILSQPIDTSFGHDDRDADIDEEKLSPTYGQPGTNDRRHEDRDHKGSRPANQPDWIRYKHTKWEQPAKTITQTEMGVKYKDDGRHGDGYRQHGYDSEDLRDIDEGNPYRNDRGEQYKDNGRKSEHYGELKSFGMGEDIDPEELYNQRDANHKAMRMSGNFNEESSSESDESEEDEEHEDKNVKEPHLTEPKLAVKGIPHNRIDKY